MAAAAVVLVIVMLLLTVVSQHVISPRVAGLRTQMASTFGSVDSTPQDSPLRSQFGRLHGLSTSLELHELPGRPGAKGAKTVNRRRNFTPFRQPCLMYAG